MDIVFTVAIAAFLLAAYALAAACDRLGERK